MGKLIDTDALKAVLMETKAESGNVGEVVVKIFCGVIDEQPDTYHNCKDCRSKYRGLCGVCARNYRDQYEREENDGKAD